MIYIIAGKYVVTRMHVHRRLMSEYNTRDILKQLAVSRKYMLSVYTSTYGRASLQLAHSGITQHVSWSIGHCHFMEVHIVIGNMYLRIRDADLLRCLAGGNFQCLVLDASFF